MAERPEGYGLTAEVRKHIEGKYSKELGKLYLKKRLHISFFFTLRL